MSEPILIDTMMRPDGDTGYQVILKFEAEVLPHADSLVFVSDFMSKELASCIPTTPNVLYRIVLNFWADFLGRQGMGELFVGKQTMEPTGI